MTSSTRPARWPISNTRIYAILLAVAALGLLPATASARDSSFSAGFSLDTHLGEGGSLSSDLFFSGTEYQGQVAPLTGLTLRLPEGVGLDSAGFPTCNKAEIEEFGLIKCPEESSAGEAGSLRAIVYLPEPKEEEAEVRTVFGPGGVLYFVVQGHTPLSLEDVFEGHFVSDIQPYGKDLVIEEIPIMKQSPSSPDVSITDLRLNLGTVGEVSGSEVWSLTLPSTCPGSFTWDAELTFLGEPSEALDTLSTGCPPAAARYTTTTTVTASSSTPYEDEPVTYTATVTPTHGGPVPTGTVTFSGTDCGAQPLVVGASSATATCQETYSDPFQHSIRAIYDGSENDRGSLSHGDTVDVQSGEAPAKHGEEPMVKHEELLATDNGDDAGGNGSSSGGSSTGSGTTTPVATISTSDLVASLKQELVPVDKAATIGSLLKRGGLSLSVKALEAGTLTVQWAYVPKGAKAAQVKPLLVAAGKLSFTAPGTGRLTLSLTAAGRRLLRHSKQVSLTARGIFAPDTGAPVSDTSGIELNR